MSSPEKETELRANELYWSSDMSVNQIADELDLSKGMLYGLIRPRPAGLACPDCSEELVYPNRTAKERGLLACPRCGWEGEEDDAEYGGDGGVVLPVHSTEDPAAVPTPSDPRRGRILMGGALLGAAAGLALVLWARRR